MKKIIILVVLLFSKLGMAQIGYTHEVGVITGPVAFYSDYGQRYDSKTNLSNSSFGVGLVYYYNFANNNKLFVYSDTPKILDYVKFRAEISYHKTDFQHYGDYAEKNSLFGKQLKAMRGSTTVTNFGLQAEYFPFGINAFNNNNHSFSPYISLGAQFSNYTPRAWSTMGAINTVGVTPTKYIGATQNEAGTAFSLVSSVGVRYNLNDYSDVLLDFRWQHYFSDWVDGLRPNPDVYTENKSNDWVAWLNVGYIYYIQ